MIEKEDVEPFKTFVRSVCACTQLCGTFPSSCRICLERCGVTILLREKWVKPKTEAEMYEDVFHTSPVSH